MFEYSLICPINVDISVDNALHYAIVLCGKGELNYCTKFIVLFIY